MEEEGTSNGHGEIARKKHKGKHDKPKPWDDDPNIDHLKIEKFDPSWNEGGMLETSEFEILFPQFREKYLQEVWPSIRSALNEHGISCELDLVKANMKVPTTCKTRDPYIIVKARELLGLLSRSVPAPQALTILDDEMQCDIIRIGYLVSSKERFVKRRQRLVGPNSSTLKALEILTGCYILVQEDIQLETGEYFLSDQKKQKKKWQEKLEKQTEKTVENKRKREAAFVPPEEPAHQDTRKSNYIGEYFASIAVSLKKKSKEFGNKKSSETECSRIHRGIWR